MKKRVNNTVKVTVTNPLLIRKLDSLSSRGDKKQFGNLALSYFFKFDGIKPKPVESKDLIFQLSQDNKTKLSILCRNRGDIALVVRAALNFYLESI